MSDDQTGQGWQQFHGANAPAVLTTFRSPSDVEVETTATGSHILKGVVIFRAGSFRDNRGIERHWTRQQLAELATNFTKLKDDGTFPNVPVRADHTISVKDVVGYFSRVYVDPADPDYLLADIEITEPEAFGKWQRGTYRSRSLEIAPYLKNGSDTPLWPVIQGIAFVDVPAVEGLHRQAPEQRFSQFIEDGSPDPTIKDVNMDPKALTHLAAWLSSGGTAESWSAACNYAKEQDDQQANHQRQQEEANQNFARACHYAAALAAHQDNARLLGLPTDFTEKFTFRIGGQETQDFAAVQSRITAMETAQGEAAKMERQSFVKQLVADNKLAAPMEAPTLAMVETMAPETFAMYRKTMEAQPVLQIFGTHGNQGHQGGTEDGNGGQPAAEEATVLKETIEQFRLMEKPDSFIKESQAYKRLIVLDPTAKID